MPARVPPLFARTPSLRRGVATPTTQQQGWPTLPPRPDVARQPRAALLGPCRIAGASAAEPRLSKAIGSPGAASSMRANAICAACGSAHDIRARPSANQYSRAGRRCCSAAGRARSRRSAAASADPCPVRARRRATVRSDFPDPQRAPRRKAPAPSFSLQPLRGRRGGEHLFRWRTHLRFETKQTKGESAFSPQRDGATRQVVREHVRALALAHVQAQPALRIEDVGSRRMVDRVGGGGGAGLLLVDDLEFLRHALGRGGVAIESRETRIERRNVCGAAAPACRAPGPR